LFSSFFSLLFLNFSMSPKRFCSRWALFLSSISPGCETKRKAAQNRASWLTQTAYHLFQSDSRHNGGLLRVRESRRLLKMSVSRCIDQVISRDCLPDPDGI
jgi:hypothetical protein